MQDILNTNFFHTLEAFYNFLTLQDYVLAIEARYDKSILAFF